MSEKILKVRMFGGFALQYEEKEIVLDRNITSKATQLLQILLLGTKTEGIAKSSLMDALYGREEVENKNASLNNTIFRLRKQLMSVGIPGDKSIIIKGGVCRWNPEILTEVDALKFKELLEQAKTVEDRAKRMDILLEACRLYSGEFLPNMLGEDWAAVKNVEYQKRYAASLEAVCRWLMEEKRYEEILQLSTTAAEIYPLENWALWQIDSLIAMSRYREAMSIYEKTTRLFFDELGLSPSQEMLKRSRIMGERISQSAGVIDDIKQRLRERERIPGAYYCTFPSFVDIYHIISRMMERNGMSVYIMLCTLRNTKDQEMEEQREKDVSIYLQESIMTVLRRGDFYTRYNQTQYLVMLPGISQENCAKVSSRIDNAFGRRVRKSDYRVDYYIASVAEMGQDMDNQVRRFQNSENMWQDAESV